MAHSPTPIGQRSLLGERPAGIINGEIGREKIMSEHRDYPPKAEEEALGRLSEPEGDHGLHAALEGMRVNHPHLWAVLHRLHLAHDADPSKLEEWRRAPEGSQEQIWAAHYDEALRVLQMSLQQ
jgi:hypothetical protein